MRVYPPARKDVMSRPTQTPLRHVLTDPRSTGAVTRPRPATANGLNDPRSTGPRR